MTPTCTSARLFFSPCGRDVGVEAGLRLGLSALDVRLGCVDSAINFLETSADGGNRGIWHLCSTSSYRSSISNAIKAYEERGPSSTLHPRVRGVQGARGQPRRRRWAQCGSRTSRNLELVFRLASRRVSESKSLPVGGLVDNGWGLQPEREQGPLRTPVGLRQLITGTGG